MSNVLVIVLQAKYEPWIGIFREGQSKTWVNHNYANIRIIQLRARSIPKTIFKLDEKIFQVLNSNIIRRFRMRLNIRSRNWIFDGIASVTKNKEYFGHESWVVNLPDSRMLGSHKTESYLNAASLEDIDYLVTTNSSTYIDLQMLQEFLESAPKSGLIAGQQLETFGPALKKLTFPHGCFRIMSADVLKMLVQLKARRHFYYPEDHYLGIKIAKIPHTFMELPICDQFDENGNNYFAQHKAIAYRCRSGENGNRLDATIMQSLHKQLKSSA